MGHLRSDRYNGVESQRVITIVHLDISIIIFTYLLDTLNSESMDMLVWFGRNKYAMDHRGFASVEEMNEYMIQKWNGKVRKNDEVVIIGDLSWGMAEQTNELLTKLNGRLYLITGNHDRFVCQPEFQTSRFTWIKPYEELSDNKRKVVLCHYPIMCYNGQYRLDEAGNPKTYMLYGHVHDTQDQRLLEQFQEITRNTKTINARGEEQSIPCNMINCFCMYSDYEPLTLDEWIELYRNRR